MAFVGFSVPAPWMRSHFSTQADLSLILLPTVIQGAAMAFFFIPLQAIVFSGLEPDRMPAAARLQQLRAHHRRRDRHLALHHRLGNRAALHHAQLAEGVSQGSMVAGQTLAQLRAAGYSGEQALAVINRMVDQQAYMLAATDLFWLSSVLFLVLIALGVDVEPTLGTAAGGGGAH